MTRCLSIALVVLSLLLATAATALAQGPGPGISSCQGEAVDAGLVLGGGAVSTVDTGSTLTIVVKQGPRISTTVVTYDDNDTSGSLSCGDTVTSIVTTIS